MNTLCETSCDNYSVGTALQKVYKSKSRINIGTGVPEIHEIRSEMDVDCDVEKYCREMSDMVTRRRPMEERYFVRRYKFGLYNFCCY